jgi:hypothetical protein
MTGWMGCLGISRWLASAVIEAQHYFSGITAATHLARRGLH